MDWTIFKAKLATATDCLHAAGREAEAASSTAPIAPLRRAAAGIDELIRLCNGEPIAAVRSCPICNHTVMAAATLCGYCWTKLTPVPR